MEADLADGEFADRAVGVRVGDDVGDAEGREDRAAEFVSEAELLVRGGADEETTGEFEDEGPVESEEGRDECEEGKDGPAKSAEETGDGHVSGF